MRDVAIFLLGVGLGVGSGQLYAWLYPPKHTVVRIHWCAKADPDPACIAHP